MFKKYSIVLVPFPFTDLSGDKVRPAMIISEKDFGDDVVVCFISTKPKKSTTHMLTVSASSENGLRFESGVRFSKIATLDKKMILGRLGLLEKKFHQQVDADLCEVFGLVVK